MNEDIVEEYHDIQISECEIIVSKPDDTSGDRSIKNEKEEKEDYEQQTHFNDD